LNPYRVDRDRQTDGRTDRQTDGQYTLSTRKIYRNTHAKKAQTTNRSLINVNDIKQKSKITQRTA